ncbi:MAG: hypothetical protein KAI66_16870 [Lentisphaeria bacterium]|nr:hypothetical protein [Lentisphaeria bacterium]
MKIVTTMLASLIAPRLYRRLLGTASRAMKLLDESSADAMRAYVEGKFLSCGAAVDRAGQADIYYTFFGLGCLRAFDVQAPPEASTFLRDRIDRGGGDFVHTAALALCAGMVPLGLPRRRALAAAIETFRTVDGGYGTKEGAACATPYATYLALLAHGALGLSPANAAQARQAILPCEQADGSYVNRRGETAANVTTTAAAAGVHGICGRRPSRHLLAWVQSQYSQGGGFRSSPNAPLPDLLSTAVALHTLRQSRVRLLPEVKRDCLVFVQDLWQEDGGFAGSIADDLTDCEYTFYALVALGALAD